jgi:spore coat protein A, manganese oxidase
MDGSIRGGITRRRLLQAGAAAAATAAFARHGGRLTGTAEAVPPGQLVNPRSLTPFIDPLPIPPTLPAAELHGGTLHLAPGSWRFHSQLGTTPTWGYTTAASGDAGYLGPTIVAERGEVVSFRAHNRLTGGHLLGVDTTLHGALEADRTHPRTALHLHGGYVDPISDGGPDHTFLPGEGWDFTYPNDQGAATLWYHDHAIGITRLNAYAGLAGLYVITDGDRSDVLPSGPFDLPLALQDKSFLGQRGTRTPNPLHYPNPWEAEFFGTAPVVNGAIWPVVDVDRGFYRFRLLNGSSARFYHLMPSNPRRVPMWAVATDSGFMRTPQQVSSVVVSPGERVEIVLDLRDAPGTVTLDDVALPLDVVSPAPRPFGPMVALRVSKRAGGGSFVPGATLDGTVPAPAALTGPTPRRRAVTLVEHVDPATGVPIMSMLNNLHWDAPPELWEQPTVDTVEVWEIVNLTADTHPIHLHLVHFLLLERQAFDVAGYLAAHPLEPMGYGPWPPPPVPPGLLGAVRGPRPFETGWKDTVQAHPGEVTRIVVPFGPNADPSVPFGRLRAGSPFTGDYVWHCHILDHEDHEMMLPYRVLPG